MGMPEQKPQVGMNIAPDGTVYEILENGTIKRIGKVSSNGKFEPFGGPQDGVRVRDGIIYRVINGKEQKIGQVLPNGDIESINQRIKSEAEISRNNVKIAAIISICCVAVAIVFVFGFIRYAEIKNPQESSAKAEAEAAAKTAELELKRINDINAKYSAKSDKVSELENWKKALQALDLKYDENKSIRNERIAVIDETISDLKTKTAEEIRRIKEEETRKIGKICGRYNTERNKSAAELESYLAELNSLKRTIKYTDSRDLDNVIKTVITDIAAKKQRENKPNNSATNVAKQEKPTPEPARNESAAPAGKGEDRQKECAEEFQQIDKILQGTECKAKTSNQLDTCINKLNQQLAKTNCDNNKQTITTQIDLIGNAKTLAKEKEDLAKQQEEKKKAEEERCRNLANEKKYEYAKTYYKGWGSRPEPKGRERKENEKILTEVLTALTNKKCGGTQVYKEVHTLLQNTNANMLQRRLESRCDCKAYKTLKWINRQEINYKEEAKKDKEVLKKCEPQCGNK